MKRTKLSKQELATMSLAQQKFVKGHMTRMKWIHISQAAILLFFLGLWEAGTRLGWLNAFIFSSPSRVVKTFISMAEDRSIFYHAGITLGETMVSFTLIIVLGLLVAVLLWWNDTAARIAQPYLVVLNSLPKSALAPVFIVWLGNNPKTIIVAAVSVAVFGTMITLFTDFISMEADKVKLIRTLGGTKKDVLLKVVIPGNIPGLISVMKVDIGLALVGVIIGEFLAAKAGLGYLIVYGSQVFKLDWVILSIVILCVLATVLYQGLAALEKHYHNR